MFSFNLDGKLNKAQLHEFAEALQSMSHTIGFKASARGWCYLLEGEAVITKDQFDRAEHYINKCRKDGLLPVDFVAEEDARQFSGVERENEETLQEYIRGYIEAPLQCYQWYTPDWWANEKVYIQMLVEKVDLKTLFSPICEEYMIPIANSKGWASVLQRAQYARRFKEAEENGLQCVLLYCGDHDPDGLRIGDFLRSNLEDLIDVQWSDGTTGYDPANLTIHRFGLNSDFIAKHKLPWINNLITGRKKNLASKDHKNFRMPYVRSYLKTFGARKCEANAAILKPDAVRKLCRDTIEKYLGKDARKRFQLIRDGLRDRAEAIYRATGLKKSIEMTLDFLDNHDDEG